MQEEEELVRYRLLPALLSAFAVLIAIFAIGERSSIDHTLDNSRAMYDSFRVVADHINFIKEQKRRYLTRPEVQSVLRLLTFNRYDVLLLPTGFRDCEGRQLDFARIKFPDYVLGAWRGEWMDCFAPRTGDSTLILTAAGYSLFGTPARDEVGWLTLSAAVLSLAVWLWRQGSKRKLLMQSM